MTSKSHVLHAQERRELLAEARRVASSGSARAAVELLQSSLLSCENDVHVWAMLGQLYTQLEDAEQAGEAFRRAEALQRRQHQATEKNVLSLLRPRHAAPQSLTSVESGSGSRKSDRKATEAITSKVAPPKAEPPAKQSALQAAKERRQQTLAELRSEARSLFGSEGWIGKGHKPVRATPAPPAKSLANVGYERQVMRAVQLVRKLQLLRDIGATMFSFAR